MGDSTFILVFSIVQFAVLFGILFGIGEAIIWTLEIKLLRRQKIGLTLLLALITGGLIVYIKYYDNRLESLAYTTFHPGVNQETINLLEGYYNGNLDDRVFTDSTGVLMPGDYSLRIIKSDEGHLGELIHYDLGQPIIIKVNIPVGRENLLKLDYLGEARITRYLGGSIIIRSTTSNPKQFNFSKQ